MNRLQDIFQCIFIAIAIGALLIVQDSNVLIGWANAGTEIGTKVLTALNYAGITFAVISIIFFVIVRRW